MTINKILYECVDSALDSFEYIDKSIFYQYLERKKNIHKGDYANNFSTIHDALKDFYGINHYKIERAIIRLLNERTKLGIYERKDEIAAFSTVIAVFMVEAEKNIKKSKSLAVMSDYARVLEGRVKEANEKLKNSERLAAIGETAAMVGHDIRNPLQAIVGELYLQQDEIELIQDSRIKNNLFESIKSIEENIFYINKIVSDLQDFAKPIDRINEEKVDINFVISEVLSIVPIPDNLQVEINIDKTVPTLCANTEMLKRVLTNLVQNAVQAMPNGGILTIRGEKKMEKAEISIEDTGKGIPEEIRSKIFKPLFTTKSKGQGLGLAVVKRLVEAQGGRVWFESNNGEGTKFFIQLPIFKI